jgi:hypothetical protein
MLGPDEMSHGFAGGRGIKAFIPQMHLASLLSSLKSSYLKIINSSVSYPLTRKKPKSKEAANHKFVIHLRKLLNPLYQRLPIFMRILNIRHFNEMDGHIMRKDYGLVIKDKV